MGYILVIEDDQQIAELLKTTLQQDHQLDFAFSGTEALYKIAEHTFDLILLDIMLPGMTGEDVLLTIRSKLKTPVIILTALHAHKKIAELLNKGANDYITKPFHIEELTARINVQLRNQVSTIQNTAEILQYKNLTLNSLTQEIYFNETSIPLTKKEFKILELLIRHPKKVYSKQELYQLIWNNDFMEDENTIHVHISNIRRKFHKLDKSIEYIETVWGIGIRLKGEPI